MKRHIVKVTWTDTVSNNSWVRGDKVAEWGRKETLIESVGFLIERNKRHVVITGMYDAEDDTHNDYQKIPVGCVKKVVRLK